MSAVLLVFLVAGMALVVFWYVFDEAARDGDGGSGLFAMRDPEKPQVQQRADWKRGGGAQPWRVGRR